MTNNLNLRRNGDILDKNFSEKLWAIFLKIRLERMYLSPSRTSKNRTLLKYTLLYLEEKLYNIPLQKNNNSFLPNSLLAIQKRKYLYLYRVHEKKGKDMQRCKFSVARAYY